MPYNCDDISFDSEISYNIRKMVYPIENLILTGPNGSFNFPAFTDKRNAGTGHGKANGNFNDNKKFAIKLLMPEETKKAQEEERKKILENAEETSKTFEALNKKQAELKILQEKKDVSPPQIQQKLDEITTAFLAYQEKIAKSENQAKISSTNFNNIENISRKASENKVKPYFDKLHQKIKTLTDEYNKNNPK